MEPTDTPLQVCQLLVDAAGPQVDWARVDLACAMAHRVIADARSFEPGAPPSATSPKDGGEEPVYPIRIASTPEVVLKVVGRSLRLSTNEYNDHGFTYLNRGRITELRDALSAFIGDEPESDKPAAEVIAEHGVEKLFIIDGNGFHLYASGSVTAATYCKVADRQEAQRVMLGWGHDPTDVQAATQAIAE